MSFKDFYTSKYGSFQFNLTGLTNITSEQCHDETGCACGNLKVISKPRISWTFFQTIKKIMKN